MGETPNCVALLAAGTNWGGPMPWPEHHKERTRARIVGAASAALRANGISGVSVAAIMSQAGLTHGGFYAHFGSKEHLLGAAVERASSETIEALSKKVQ